MTNVVSHGRALTIQEPEGGSQLPLVEVKKDKVLKKHGRIVLPKKDRETADSSYGPFDGSRLHFSAWELFHAAKKTELTRSFTSQRADELAFVFAHEHHDRLIWNTDNLRCADGSGLWLEDFSGKGLAGRIGEALAYLTMTKKWGYTYWDRIASVWIRAASNSHINHRDMVKAARFTGCLTSGQFDLQPDFVFEKPNGNVALMEAKGSFITPGNDHPNAKGPLKHGLDQTAKWANLISPAPSECIAISSLLREQSDRSSDPSLILHVDPPPGEQIDIEPAELPVDTIRRANIGAWLTGMGFQTSGIALTTGREYSHADTSLPVVTINGFDFAIRIHGWRVDPDRHVPPPFMPFECKRFTSVS